MQQWKAGNTLVEVWEEGDDPFGQCSIAGCDGVAIWRAGGTQRCVDHVDTTKAALGQHKPPGEM